VITSGLDGICLGQVSLCSSQVLEKFLLIHIYLGEAPANDVATTNPDLNDTESSSESIDISLSERNSEPAAQKTSQAQPSSAADRSGNRKSCLNFERTYVCGIYSPGDPGPVRPYRAKYHETVIPKYERVYLCPRCELTCTRALTVRHHFGSCIARNGNPDRMNWYDHPSVRDATAATSRKRSEEDQRRNRPRGGSTKDVPSVVRNNRNPNSSKPLLPQPQSDTTLSSRTSLSSGQPT